MQPASDISTSEGGIGQAVIDIREETRGIVSPCQWRSCSTVGSLRTEGLDMDQQPQKQACNHDLLTPRHGSAFSLLHSRSASVGKESDR